MAKITRREETKTERKKTYRLSDLSAEYMLPGRNEDGKRNKTLPPHRLTGKIKLRSNQSVKPVCRQAGPCTSVAFFNTENKT